MSMAPTEALKTMAGGGGSSWRPRVLMLAESCNPEWISVPLVGWSHYQAVAQLADVHLVTRTRNVAALRRVGLKEGDDFTAIDTEFVFEPMVRLVRFISGKGRGWTLLMALTLPSYLLFEHLAWRRFRRRLRSGQFDVVHRVTPVSPAVPSPLASRCRRLKVPFVLGPLNGGLAWPKQYPELRHNEREGFSRFRDVFKLLPGYRRTREAANAIIVGGRSALAEIPRRWRAKTIYLPENGYDPARFPTPPVRTADAYVARPLRAIFIGRLVPYKGCDLLLEAAAALIASGRLTLDIIGDGPENGRLRQLAADLGIETGVRFLGECCHRVSMQHLVGADILTFPSLREFGGAVVLEAMAMGVVPIVVNYGGPGELASPDCAFLLQMKERSGLVHDLRDILAGIVADPAQLVGRAERGMRRARRFFAWPRKAEQILCVYRWVVGRTDIRPDWGAPFSDVDDGGDACSA